MQYPDKCPSCGDEYNPSSVSCCGNSFHCCRACVWENGELIEWCKEHYHHLIFKYPPDNSAVVHQVLVGDGVKETEDIKFVPRREV